MVECLHDTQEVAGSIPAGRTIKGAGQARKRPEVQSLVGTQPKERALEVSGSNPDAPALKIWAHSSVEERHSDKVEAPGPIPGVPTK